MVSADTDQATRNAARDAAAALRRLTASVAAADIPKDELAAAATQLSALADQLEHHPATNSIFVPGSDPFDESSWDRHCVLGRSNALAPPVRITANHERGREVVIGECTLT
jgi:hypothetical protein